MADERYVPGQTFEIRPLHIVAGRPQTFGSGIGRAYGGNGDGWGLQEGSRRGEGGPLDSKWASYHDALLKFESARHLTLISNAFGALAERAREVAKEQARLAAESEARGKATQAQAHTFRLAPAGATQLSVAAGSIAITAGSSLTLEAAIQTGIQALKALGGAVLDRATGVGIGLLLYSPSLGNSDLYPPTTLSLPAKDLIPDLPENLLAIAATGGTVDLPYRVYGDRSKYSVIATQCCR